jgi:oligosaccharyltransferase complex subunit alpha (ribophorin I)
MRRTTPSPSFRSLTATLPAQASNIYYRDQIGNISTSDLRIGSEAGTTELDIQTRFPLYGGWQTQFYLGYNIPTETAVFVDAASSEHRLKFDFFSVFKEVWVEDMEVKVILPEGCYDIKVQVPYPVEESRSIR